MKHLNFIFLISLLLSSCHHQPKNDSITTSCYKLKPLTQKKHPIRAGEWRAKYTEAYEPLQAYISKHPTSTTDQRKKLYVVQIGAFDTKGKEILEDTKAYLHAFFQIDVAELPLIDLKCIAPKYTRTNTYGLQLKTTVILDSLLPALLPDSAFALIAFTTKDLYPNDDWNYVFGQASLERRVGVWSIARMGDYNKDAAHFSLCLKRTLQVASHETGHIFGMPHCVQNECCMNGSISQTESDEQTSVLCWECLAKICWNRKIMPQKHLAALLQFNKTVTHDTTAQNYYTQALSLLK
jgi:archaemetzincin